MSYYRAHNRSGSGRKDDRERFKGTEIEATMQRISQIENLTPWERDFINSLCEGYKKYNSLTQGQHKVLKKISTRYNPVNIQKREDWKKSFTDEMRQKLEIMARYYLENPPYFSDLARRILDEPDYIPTEKAYRSMCENKYAQRVINTANSPPEYPAGSMVMVRNSKNIGGTISRHRGEIVVILDHPKVIANAARGARPLRVLPIGSTEPIETEERWLKKLPKSLT